MGTSGAHTTEWIGEGEQALVHLYDPPLGGPVGNSGTSARPETTETTNSTNETLSPGEANAATNLNNDAPATSENQRNSLPPEGLSGNENRSPENPAARTNDNAPATSENRQNSLPPEDLHGDENRSRENANAGTDNDASVTSENQQNSSPPEDPNEPTSSGNRPSSRSRKDTNARSAPPPCTTRPATKNKATLREIQALDSSSSWLSKALARMSLVKGTDWLEAVSLWEELENGEPSVVRNIFLVSRASSLPS